MNSNFYFMDQRITAINKRLSEYSLGRFDKRLALSAKLDAIDAVINGINMLGEELKAITISRNYFNSIFNAVSDMVFVVNSRGVIEDANQAAEAALGYKSGTLTGTNMHVLVKENKSFYNRFKKQLAAKGGVTLEHLLLYPTKGPGISVKINASRFSNDRKRQLILLTANDIRLQLKTENLIIRAIIDTQEKERQRLAKDLHDSLTQQLSAIKFYISSINEKSADTTQTMILSKSREALSDVIMDMRNICFNLMPRTLQEFGLVTAVREFCHHFAFKDTVAFTIRENRRLPAFSTALSIDLYRVIQEFIANALRHGRAKRIVIEFRYRRKALFLLLVDDGIGFDAGHVLPGMGLQNVQSRVKSHQGSLVIESSLHKGTSYKILIPLNPLTDDNNPPG